MKRILVILLLVFSFTLSGIAETLGFTALFQGNHKSIHMSPDGHCWIDSRQTGRIHGTYDCSAPIEIGCSNVRVTFDFNGQTYSGTLMWPAQDGLKLYFDGTLMNRVS